MTSSSSSSQKIRLNHGEGTDSKDSFSGSSPLGAFAPREAPEKPGTFRDSSSKSLASRVISTEALQRSPARDFRHNDSGPEEKDSTGGRQLPRGRNGRARLMPCF
jgi:hypothetical protein